MRSTAREASAGVAYLALETSGPVGSLAIGRGGEVLARVFLAEARQQSSAMLPALRKVLGEAGMTVDAVGGVVVGAGPGSFTGVRIAAATAKGIVHALDVPLWAVSSLASAAISDLALPVGSGPDGWWEEGPFRARSSCRYVLFDAREDRVYAACYWLREGAALQEVVPGRPVRLGELLEGPLPPGVVFTGDGALRHRERIRTAGHAVLGPPAGAPTADGLLQLRARWAGGAPLAEPGRWEPEYMKASGAERGRAP